MARAQIMVVEDESIVAEDMKAMLEGFGYAVPAMAFSGEEAVKKALTLRPDLVLMDIVLKGKMSGMEAVERIRAQANIPVVYVTAYADENTVRRAKLTEPFGYLLKPFDARELQTAIEIALYKHQMESKLKASEAWLATTLRSISDAVMTTDTQGCVTFMNPVAQALTGWPQEDAVGRPVTDILQLSQEGGQPLPKGPVVKALREGVNIDLAPHNLVLRAKDGTIRPIDDSVAPIRDEQGHLTGAVVVFRDVSERRRLQEQLMQAQKMDAVGRLAGTVAHDFNNMLTVISVYSELLMSRRSRQEQLHHYAQEIKKAVERATTLTGQLLTLSHKQLFQPKILDLNAMLSGMEEVLRRLIGDDIELVLLRGPGLGSIKMDPGQLEQVIMNLVVNAHDAMPQGGKLTVETMNVEFDERHTRRYADLKPGPYVRLTVSDTGCGMDEATRARLFEPFFTTKPRGKGTGLGLSIVYRVVTQSQGHIEVDSAPGCGTLFRIYLPQAEEVAVPEPPSPPSARLLEGQETVLLVEDEEEVCTAIFESLQMRGYTVLKARHAREALLLCRRHSGPIHLLLTDVLMPQMTGTELAQRLLLSRPDLKVLYMSGYTRDALVERNITAQGTAFLQKPFTPDMLARALRDVLRTSTSSPPRQACS